ncbi:preprotein translocase subunit YajC [Ruania zhangjianzhongii]|uniref:preprotein translocase subunit YajC n=1 Tax=Ruania zhangjianzhongii TaxID=2603206 RepID=UPI0011CA72F9|nr:preprotein translocase subunit YajC [Ruania zhangjianzhongii]
MDPTFIIILVVGLGALLFMNWRTRKKQQEQLSFRDRLEIGQEVQTIGGLIGTITAVEDDRITLETAPGTEVVFVKMALAKLVDPPVEEFDDETELEGSDEASEPAEAVEADVVESPEVPDEQLSAATSPDAGDDDTPRRNQN